MVVTIGILSLALAACSSAGFGRTVAGETADRTSPPTSSPLQPKPQTSMERMNAIKQAVDHLAAANLSDVQFLDEYLSAAFEAEATSGPFTVRRSKGGSIAGIEAGDIELRTMNDNPAHALLIIDLAEPGPEASAFVHRFWPNAEFVPARPHAPASSAYWSTEQGGGSVKIGLPSDKDQINSIIIDRMPR